MVGPPRISLDTVLPNGDVFSGRTGPLVSLTVSAGGAVRWFENANGSGTSWTSHTIATKTSTGLEVYARLDDGEYPAKIRVSDAELHAVNLHHGRVPRGMDLQHQTTN